MSSVRIFIPGALLCAGVLFQHLDAAALTIRGNRD